MIWDKTLTRIVREVSEEMGIKPEDLKFAIETFFKKMRNILDKSKGTAYILIRNFGRFFVKRGLVNNKIVKIIHTYRAGDLAEEEFRRILSAYLDLRRRINEERPSTGKSYKQKQAWKKRLLEDKGFSKESNEPSTSGEKE